MACCHQTFNIIRWLVSRLTHKASQSEIIYVAEAAADSGSSKLYKFELDLGAQIDEFKSKSGDYSIALLLGKLGHWHRSLFMDV